MRFQTAIFMLALALLVSADPSPPPSNYSQGSVLRIEGNSVLSAESVQSATLTILYNYPASGFPAQEEAEGRITLKVNNYPNPIPVQYLRDGVFTATFAPDSIGLLDIELPDGPYWANASVTENSVEYKAYEPKAVIVLKKRTPVPETHLAVIALFLFAAMLAMRRQKR